MKYVNVVFGDDLSDVDIISAPDDVAENIEDLGQQFCNWLSNDEAYEYRRVAENGIIYGILETNGFVTWLNRFHCGDIDEKAVIVVEHTDIDFDLPIVEF